MSAKVDLTGQRFGRLIVIKEDYAELYSVRETEMRKTILAKVRGWRGDKHGDKLPKEDLF